MSAPGLPETAGRDGTWLLVATLLTGAIAIASAVIGFVVLPSLEPGTTYAGLWSSICSAAGLIRPHDPGDDVVRSTYATTTVALSSRTLSADAGSVGRGATLALGCTMCHGERGLSHAESPNLAGQHAVVVYKQLRDFVSGARLSDVMTPLVAGMSDRDMRDLAAYFAFLPRVHASHPRRLPAPLLVAAGAPMRGIAPCASCHGGLGTKLGSAWLEGQPAAYLVTQLDAFAEGARRNDIDAQMRNVARSMTPAEMRDAAAYYAGREEGD